MIKFWSRICCEVHAGKELQQAPEDAQKEYEEWSSPEQKRTRAKMMEGVKVTEKKGFKTWVEDEVLPQIEGWHLL